MSEIQPSTDAQATAIAIAYSIVKMSKVTPGDDAEAKAWGELVGAVAQAILAKTHSRSVATAIG